MYRTVPSLQKCCANFVCDHLYMFCVDRVTTDSYGLAGTKVVFEDPNACFNADVSELLLSTLNEMGKLDDSALLLFDPDISALHHVIIHDAQICNRGLSILQGHRVSQLEVSSTRDLGVGEVLQCLGKWTLSNLRILSVSNVRHKTYPEDSKLWASSLSGLKTLHTLNVSFTCLSQEGLEVIAENLSCLEVLDISGNKIHDISPLRKLRHYLKSLSMYNLLFDESDPVGVVSELSLLVHLDVSSEEIQHRVDPASPDAKPFPLPEYLSRYEVNPNLVSLDISAAMDIEPHILKSYLETHQWLKFLGLALTNMSNYEMFKPESMWYRSRPGLKVAGSANIPQLLECLRRHISRTSYMMSVLHDVFILTRDRNFQEPRESIIEVIIPVMKVHYMNAALQLSSTACLANLLRDPHHEPNDPIHPTLTSLCIKVSLDAMDYYIEPCHHQLHRNVFLVLCNNRVLEDVNFDRLHCLRVILKCICSYKAIDSSLNRMAVAVCSVLIRKISRAQVAVLVSETGHVSKLLEYVREGSANYEGSGITLRFTLAALWSLTDECPEACSVFVAQGGIELLMDLLKMIEGKGTEKCVELRRKCLGVLSNIAETHQFRCKIIQADLMRLIRGMLLEETLDVSYLAADIVAHLCTESEALWASRGCNDRDTLLQDLETVVMNWDQSKKIPVTYRTFRPFYILLQCEALSVKWYSLWAIRNFCASDGKSERYLNLLDSENGQEHIKTVITSPFFDPKVKVICQDILDLLAKHKGEPLT